MPTALVLGRMEPYASVTLGGWPKADVTKGEDRLGGGRTSSANIDITGVIARAAVRMHDAPVARFGQVPCPTFENDHSQCREVAI